MIFHEYSLIFFTVFAQTAVGAYLLLSARAIVKNYDEEKLYRFTMPMFFLWALMGLGFLFSTTHLGSPLRAFNAFNQLGKAWLSNEIFLGAAFFAIGGLQWLLSALKIGKTVIHKFLMILAMFLGAAFMYAMIKVYMIDTVPTWFNSFTPLSFGMTMLIAGLLLSQLVILLAGDSYFMLERCLAIVAMVVVAVSFVVTMGRINLLENIHTSVAKASELVEGLDRYVGIQTALLLTGVVIWVLPLLTKSKLRSINLWLALGFVLASELIGRALFYSTHMTYGL